MLSVLQRRALEGKFIASGELRDMLRRAAALLCRSIDEQCFIVQYLVSIPFIILTKQSMQLGISIWLGVINESPRMEPRFLIETTKCWEVTVRRKLGIFNDKLLLVSLPKVASLTDKSQTPRSFLRKGRICTVGQIVDIETTACNAQHYRTSPSRSAVPS